MAKSNSNNNSQSNEQANKRSQSIDVGPDLAPALAAGYDGLFYLFGARVENWEVTPEGLFAHGYTVDEKYSDVQERVLHDIAMRVRRPQLMPTILWINGIEPQPFPSNQAITTFLVQFFKGSVEEGTSKVPEYARKAAEAYRASQPGTYTRKGPKPKGLAFKDISNADENVLLQAGLTLEEIQHLAQIANTAMAARQHQADEASAVATATTEESVTVSA
jgi:hypothetical protein